MRHPRVTVLIPSHQRPKLLARALRQYVQAGLPVVVADSSPQPMDTAEEFAAVRYLHLPGAPFEEKLQRMAAMLQTPYAVLCADDDLTSTASILRCAAFLDANPDHSGAHGHYVRVVRGPGEAVVEPCYPDTHVARIASGDPAGRLLELSRPYVPLFYAVLRAQVLREAFGSGHEAERFYAASELALGMATAILGKVAVLPTLHTLRDIVPSQDLGGRKNHNLLVVSTAPEYRPVYQRFVDRMTALLGRTAGLDADAARRAVLASVQAFVDGYCLPGGRKNFIQKLPKYCRRAARALLPPLAARARAQAACQRQAALNAYLAPVGPEGRAELAAMLERFRSAPG